MKVNNIVYILYLLSLLIIIIPITIVLISNFVFNATLSRIIVTTAGALFIIGKVLTMIQKRKENKRIAADIGIVIGVAIAIFL